MTETVVHAPPKFEDHIGIIHMQAKFGLKWAHGAGVRMDYDDMFQEASLAFLAAAKGYDPETGLKFSTYFTKVAFSQFRQTIGVMTGVKNLNTTQRGNHRAQGRKQAPRCCSPAAADGHELRSAADAVLRGQRQRRRG
ncbi:hypothetical protein LP414_27185 [Polaromonas sp. P1(28)-13]|nr:hypothetical protein LP414_27185 [Polaromonas sp. P1(28)-13]